MQHTCSIICLVVLALTPLVSALSCQLLPDLPLSISESPEALFREQQETSAKWIQAYTDRDVDTYINHTSEPYIQHNPNIPSGKAVAERYLKGNLERVGLVNNVTRIFYVPDYVILHVHRTQPGVPSRAIIDIYRLNGTCIIEHWDVHQVIDPNAPNPQAFF